MTLYEIGGFHNSDAEISVFWDVTPRSYSETSAWCHTRGVTITSRYC